MSAYERILARHGFHVTLRHPWAIVGEVNRVQGWKLHISSIQTEAAGLLERIAPTLKRAGVAFKVIGDARLLGLLNEGALGETQIGKFATVYPASDATARFVAGELLEALRGFQGPRVATDLRLGGVVYARFGAFQPIVIRDRLGQHASYIRDSKGRLSRDEYTMPFSSPAGVSSPFEKLLESSRARVPMVAGSRARRQDKLFGPGFLLLDVLKPHAKGAVFRGLDLRKRNSIEIWVLKQGRQWCLSDRLGRDIRTRLRHQNKVHAALKGRAPIPNVDEYFEVDGDGYLPVEHLRGRTFFQVVGDTLRSRPWRGLTVVQQRTMISHFINTIAAVERMHAAGYVHRDLNADNILIGDEGHVYLLDLELSHAVDDASPAFTLGTLGYMSPGQRAHCPPCFADDVYSLGALALLMLTGLDPRQQAVAAPAYRVEQWKILASNADPRLVELAASCLVNNPAQRPSLSHMRRIISRCLPSTVKGAGGKAQPQPSFLGAQQGLTVRHGLRGLMHHTVLDQTSGLWLSHAFDGHGSSPLDGKRRYELRRSANRGVAGMLYVLGRLARFGHRTRGMKLRARQAAAWLVQDRTAPDAGMPGLHFGDAGVAVGLVEAIAGGLLTRTPELEKYIRGALSGVIDWPDLTHGAAGQGLAALYCGDRLNDPKMGKLSGRCARYLVETQRSRGDWIWPTSTMGGSDEVLTGFAHGVAGIIYFLADYARRYADSSAERAWLRGAEWLIRRAERVGNALWWQVSDKQPERWRWWCHGSVGIGLLFLRLHEQTGDTRFADIAQGALRVHPREFLSANLSQCHGVSGVGEAYLEAHRVLGGHHWQRRAVSALNFLWSLRRCPRPDTAIWLVEDPYVSTADLMVGSAGVVHLFLRASVPTAPIGPPLLLDPLA